MSALPLDPNGLISIDEWDEIADKELEWIVNELIPSQSIALLVGDSGVGKSPLLWQLAMCLAAGIPFLGRRTKRCKVVYFDYENSRSDIKRLRDGFRQFLGIKEDLPNFKVWSAAVSPNTGLAANLMTIESFRPDIAIIDTLGNADPEIENLNSVARDDTNAIRDTMRRTGGALIEAHHPVKGQSSIFNTRASIFDPDPRNRRGCLRDVRGPAAIVNATDTRLVMQADPKREDVVGVWGIIRGWDEVPLTFLERVKDGSGTPIGYKVTLPAELIGEKVLEWLRRLPEEFSYGQAKAAWGGDGESSVSRGLKEAQTAMAIGKVGKGLYRKLVRG